MKECEKGRVMMFMWFLTIMKDFGTTWKGKLCEGGYNIVEKQVS